MSAKEISAPVDIGNQGSGNINLGSVANGVFLPGLTASQVLQLNGSKQIISGTLAPSLITPGLNGQVLETVGGVASWQTLTAVTSMGANVLPADSNSAIITGNTLQMAIASPSTTGVMYGVTNGQSFTNIGFGRLALNTIGLNVGPSGFQNTAIGEFSGQNISSGNNNTLVGYDSGSNMDASANTGLGSSTLSGVTTGSAIIAIGVGTPVIQATGNNSVYIGNSVTAGAANATREYVIGHGITGLGDNSFTIDPVAVPVGADNALQISLLGQLTRAASSQRYKDPLPDPSIGANVSYLDQLAPRAFTFKNDSTKAKHLGFYAEEVEAIKDPQGNSVFEQLLSFMPVDDTSQPPIGTKTDRNGNQVPVYPQKLVVDSIKYDGFVVPLVTYCKWLAARCAQIETHIGLVPPTPTN